MNSPASKFPAAWVAALVDAIFIVSLGRNNKSPIFGTELGVAMKSTCRGASAFESNLDTCYVAAVQASHSSSTVLGQLSPCPAQKC